MIGLITDVGMVRSLNEDFVEYLENENFGIYVVADGMGGHNAGEVASKIAAQGIVEYISNRVDTEDKYELLESAIKNVNHKIYTHSLKDYKLSGMGTTITACFRFEDRIQVANVGDSCCFGIKRDVIRKITKDHSLVQELVDIGTISEDEALNHPRKNIITRAVGTSDNVKVDIFDLDIEEYDFYLLCSDGLTNELCKEEILKIVYEQNTLLAVCEKLVNLAKVKGGRDNITVLLFGGEMYDDRRNFRE